MPIRTPCTQGGDEPQNSGTLLTMYQEFMYQGGSPFPHGTLFMGGDVIPIHKGAATVCQRCEMSSFCVLFDGSGIVHGPNKIARRSCRSDRFDGKDIVHGLHLLKCRLRSTTHLPRRGRPSHRVATQREEQEAQTGCRHNGCRNLHLYKNCSLIVEFDGLHSTRRLLSICSPNRHSQQ